MKTTNNRLAEMIKNQCLKLSFGVAMGALFTGAAIGLSNGSAQAATIHNVQAGETLSSIATKSGVDWHDLASTNGLSNPDLIDVGQQISIDGSSTNTNAAPAAVETPAAPAVETPAATSTAPGGSVESMVEQTFGPHAEQAKRVAMCESTMNPNAQNPSGASGLFQILPSTFASTSQAGKSVYDPAANVQAAYEVFSRDGFSWNEWVCQP
jgi:soluble lytic murein transglycosylase-like protein